MLKKWRAHFILLMLVALMLDVSCSMNTNTQTIAVIPSVTTTTDKLFDTPLNDPSSPPTTSGTLIIPIPTVDLPFTIVRIFPSRVDLSDRLAQEVRKADQLGYTPVVEFDAHW